jgi:acetyl-CoA C-acetyltransferase
MTAYLYDAVRTPRGRGKSNGSLHTTRPVDLLAQVLGALRDRNNLQGQTHTIDDVVIGCVTQIGDQGQCIARTAALVADYDLAAPGVTLNRFCGSGLEAINHAAAMVASGFHDLVVAGGVESMSRVEMGSDGGALLDAATELKLNTVPQGISADLIATLWGFGREDVDRYALTSQQRATVSWERRAFSRSIIPVKDMNGLTVLDRDELIRPDTTLEGLAKLKPAFEMIGKNFAIDELTKKVYPQVEHIHHVHHAGNASGIVDGAAVVLVGSKEAGERLGLKPRAKVRSVALAGSEPIIMLTGPLPAAEKALKKAGMKANDVDHYEVNEAFAVVPLMFAHEFGLDLSKVNPDGGAIAMGHPLGATGAMLLGTALDAMERDDKQTALITLCIGGGMGIATIIERV